MPSIGEMEYGYEAGGVESYIEEIRVSSLEKAVEAADDTGALLSALENNWEGKAREQYIENLKVDIRVFQDAIQSLYSAFVKEVQNATVDMYEFDQNLIK